MLRFFLLISVGATMLLPRVGKDVTLLNGVDGIFRLKFLGFMEKRLKQIWFSNTKYVYNKLPSSYVSQGKGSVVTPERTSNAFSISHSTK